MKRFLKVLKRFFQVLGILLVLLTVVTLVFVNTSPQFGQVPEGEDLARIEQSPNYGDDRFNNVMDTKVGSFGDMLSTIGDMFGDYLQPKDTLPTRFGIGPNELIDSVCYITWYGHSAFLMEMDGVRILIDPMLGEVASPVSFGATRWPYEQAIPIEELTNIDILIISHDHYDHLDHSTILALKDEVKHFVMPLGVGSHLKSWGVPAASITELDWWEEVRIDGVNLVACPSRHFSGRGLTDRYATQWASWVVRNENQNLYFSGDGGYGPHFAEIGEKYGPFDLAMMECGQYNEAWPQIHMMPEESVQAGIDVGGELLMPIHWGAFTLAVHEWKDPIRRFKAESDKRGVSFVHPLIGQRFALGDDLPTEEWWEEVE